MILKQAQSENYKLVFKSLPTTTKSLSIENVIQFVNHDKKSKMRNKYDIFNSWRENSFPYQTKKIFKLF